MSYPYFFISPENINENNIEIFSDDLKHLSKVLRSKTGDKVEVSDNYKYRYLTEIIDIKKDKAVLKILKKLEIKKSAIKIFLFQCILKSSSMEFVIQKATEIGLETIIPVKSKRIVVNEKYDNQKLSRWNKIALEASKQSKRNFKCEILNELSINDINPDEFDIFFIPYEKINPLEIKNKNIIDNLKYILKNYIKNNNLTTPTIIFSETADKTADNDKILLNPLLNPELNYDNNLKIGFIVGPEGGFEEKEVDDLVNKGATPVSLGSNILKAETAAVFMSSIIKYTVEAYE
ncbi:MAG: 16S rRNA (uracil(1498)-N(3))-methyltransferase [Actinobacteria bacterium]|nr:16S rRNA (uracil(1498)-N(3))-methyltransferase [Cyanobacteriota bacterium]MCL5772618.1 16S rRNA (uracil(1498)-N(3))-methyltransferase [Actinomycetota bacterium]